MKSRDRFENARQYIAGGISTPLFDGHKSDPGIMYVSSATGSKITDIDGRDYVDFVCGYGTLILGHAYPDVVTAVNAQMSRGSLYVLPIEDEITFCQKLVESSSAIDQIRLVCSGSEAVMTAVRLAKNYTSRFKILKFAGSYHGHADTVLGRFYPGACKGQFGIDPEIFESTLVIDYNDVEALERVFSQHANDIAAVLVEPVLCNMGLVNPSTEFLMALRSYCDHYGSILIFDEVITGFRFNYGSVSARFPVLPDLVTFGKIIGGGLAVGAYGGKKHIMQYNNSEVTGFHFSGTFSANPLVVASGLATLRVLEQGSVYRKIDELGIELERLVHEQHQILSNRVHFSRKGAVFSLRLIKNGEEYPEAMQDHSQLHTLMLARGCLMTPNPYETMYISAAHSVEDMQHFVKSLVDSVTMMIEQHVEVV